VSRIRRNPELAGGVTVKTHWTGTAMSTTRTATGAIALLIGVALGTSACTGTTSGIPLPATDDKSANRQLAVLDPCALLTKAEVDHAGLRTKGRTTDELSGRGCGWTSKSTDPDDGFTLGVVLNTRYGLDNLGDSKLVVTDDPIGKHPAKQARDPDETAGSSCFVIIGVTGSSRVDLFVVTGPGGACELANQYARKIEPRLPRGSS
jgi:hypothetical protein